MKTLLFVIGIFVQIEKHLGIGDVFWERVVHFACIAYNFLIGVIFGEHEFFGEVIFDIKLHWFGRFVFFVKDTFRHSFHGIDLVVERFEFDKERSSDVKDNERENDPEDIFEIFMIAEHGEKEHQKNSQNAYESGKCGQTMVYDDIGGTLALVAVIFTFFLDKHGTGIRNFPTAVGASCQESI